MDRFPLFWAGHNSFWLAFSQLLRYTTARLMPVDFTLVLFLWTGASGWRAYTPPEFRLFYLALFEQMSFYRSSHKHSSYQ